MKRIGIIGVGEIGRAIVTGLYDGDDEPPEMFLSPRRAGTVAELSERFERVRVCADNQDVVDRSEVVIIAVRGQDRHEALTGLRVEGDKLVVSVMAALASLMCVRHWPLTSRWSGPFLCPPYANAAPSR
ncbi:NAD(P)-binding domain-containing protein [Actinomadura madurae]|uniref:NAD(P)-binding domain-containing protein n=1 Tax=Actinomadura madurae TaxID=1993 RepID=UPI0020D25BCF|nr:NAD(P)-binding domain-containing protein [Actinomadura madurae]MCP9976863.1 NAD(P)-binding domain-containing protein [Actinomadura madurae]